MKGYALITKLRADADDCQRPDRAELMRDAADEIERLIQEVNGLLNAEIVKAGIAINKLAK